MLIEHDRGMDIKENPLKRIYVVRHGETPLKGTYTGSTDVSLSERGKKQVGKLSTLLSRYPVDICYSSPLKRCRQTFELLNLSCELRVEEQLREIDFGNWEGKTFAQIYEADRDQVDTWCAQELSFTFPGGEGVADFIGRLTMFQEALLADPQQNILLICHGGVSRFLICLFLGIPLHFNHKFEITASGLTVINGWDGDFWLVALNKFLN